MVSYLRKMLDVVQILILTRRPLQSVFSTGYSIASAEIVNNIKKYCPSIATIIDVGANQGQFALASVWGYPSAHIVSFEPLPDVFELLTKNTRSNKQVAVFNVALGREKGFIDFYQNSHSHASSALPISTFQVAELPETAEVSKIQVPVDTLDHLAVQLAISGPVLLKLDVQGYEKQVLEGGTEFLKQVDYLVFEASFVSMYEGEPLFSEMHAFVLSKGFELVAPVGALKNKNGQYLQLDLLYKKAPDHLYN